MKMWRRSREGRRGKKGFGDGKEGEREKGVG